jgi:hypothetical protein
MEREFLSPRYEAIDILGDSDCPSVLVANDLQAVKGLTGDQCREVFDAVCGATGDDGHSISYRQYCVIMRLGAMLQTGKPISVDVAKELDSENQQVGGRVGRAGGWVGGCAAAPWFACVACSVCKAYHRYVPRLFFAWPASYACLGAWWVPALSCGSATATATAAAVLLLLLLCVHCPLVSFGGGK